MFSDNKTHWFEERNEYDQRLRFCNQYVTGIFATEFTQVDCPDCIKALEKREV